MSDMVFAVLDEYVREKYQDVSAPRFPIMDFYLDARAGYGIYGVVAENLRLVDVGKFDTLEAAEGVLRELEITGNK
jgi:hypothetical protein